YYQDEDKFLFASELKSLLAYGIKKEIDAESLYHYLQLNYTPAPHSMLKHVKKVMPGHAIRMQGKKVEYFEYYKIPFNKADEEVSRLSYQDQQARLKTLLHESVKKRLVADVPVGTFLSGG